MTEQLSPAAQAVLDAFRADWKDEHLKQDVKCLAAALQAAADQVVPEYRTTPGGSKIWSSEPVPSIRAGLLAIADELGGQQ